MSASADARRGPRKGAGPAGVDLTGRTVLVAGSSRGIGAATARIAAGLGASVVVHGRRPSDELDAVASEIGALSIWCDGTDPGEVRDACESLDARGVGVDHLVCTLGTVRRTPALEPLNERWIEEYSSNVLGPVNFVQAIAPGMLERGRGSIALVSSIRGRDSLASPEIAAYSAAKAALENVTTAFAKELAPRVRVNAVAPGFVLTDMAETWSDRSRAQVEASLLARAAEAEEIGWVLNFLISDASSFMTGQTLLVDGGLDARM
ncbi:MAG: SDR family NAD(P)-dependent oxidoreductase [Leucobacter sp.]